MPTRTPAPSLPCRVCADERGVPTATDRAAVLSRLLDFPRLLDICSLYGPAAAAGANGPGGASTAQLPQLMAAALQLLPHLCAQAAQAGPLIAQNLGQVAEACLAAAGSAARDADMAQSLQGARLLVPAGSVHAAGRCCACLLCPALPHPTKPGSALPPRLPAALQTGWPTCETLASPWSAWCRRTRPLRPCCCSTALSSWRP